MLLQHTLFLEFEMAKVNAGSFRISLNNRFRSTSAIEKPLLGGIIALIILVAAGISVSLYTGGSTTQTTNPASQNGSSTLTVVTNSSISPSLVLAQVFVRTPYKGSSITITANGPANPSPLHGTLNAANGTLPNGSEGYLGYYSGTFEIASGLAQGVNVSLTVKYESYSATGTTTAPASGQTSFIPLVINTLLGSSQPLEISVANGASTCTSLSGAWNSTTDTCTTHGFLDVSLTIDSGVTLTNTGMLDPYDGNDVIVLGAENTITNYGTFNNNPTYLDNSGYINNFGTINNGGYILNQGNITNNGKINNLCCSYGGYYDRIDNSGILTNGLGATINNANIFNNNKFLDNQGALSNYDVFNNGGTFDNGILAIINNSAWFTNSGVINNFGVITASGSNAYFTAGDLNNEGGSVCYSYCTS